MPTNEDKLVQYLIEARATELALVRTLQAHIAMTPSGEYRTLLETHLRETRGHAERVSRRLADLGRSPSIVETVYDIGQRLTGQLLALGKGPLDMLRGGSGEEKLLKNAKDEAATEALEIATYDAIEALARASGDTLTARLAADHRADEERMLAALRRQLPALTGAVVAAEVEGRPSYDVARTGAAQAARAAARELRRDAGDAAAEAARAGRRATADARRAASRAVDAVAERASGAASATSDAVDDAADAVREAVGAPSETTEEREQQRRPFADYDDLNVDQVIRRLDTLTPARLRHVATYERGHKRRRGVLEAVERQAAAEQEQQGRETVGSAAG
jgi:ferritin-like metal-binding protein YciE